MTPTRWTVHFDPAGGGWSTITDPTRRVVCVGRTSRAAHTHARQLAAQQFDRELQQLLAVA